MHRNIFGTPLGLCVVIHRNKQEGFYGKIFLTLIGFHSHFKRSSAQENLYKPIGFNITFSAELKLHFATPVIRRQGIIATRVD